MKLAIASLVAMATACLVSIAWPQEPKRRAAKEESLVQMKGDDPVPGYRWVMEPQENRGSLWAVGHRDGVSVVGIEEKDKDGALQLTLAHPAPKNAAGLSEFRVVAFDAAGNRHLLQRQQGAFAGEIAMYRFSLDKRKLPPDKVKRLGVEMLTPEGIQMIAREAIARAAKEGVEVLPSAEVGKNYDFVLTTIDGSKLRSQDMHGKVMLLDCWSST
jgi:hypothetical protein